MSKIDETKYNPAIKKWLTTHFKPSDDSPTVISKKNLKTIMEDIGAKSTTNLGKLWSDEKEANIDDVVDAIFTLGNGWKARGDKTSFKGFETIFAKFIDKVEVDSTSGEGKKDEKLENFNDTFANIYKEDDDEQLSKPSMVPRPKKNTEPETETENATESESVDFTENATEKPRAEAGKPINPKAESKPKVENHYTEGETETENAKVEKVLRNMKIRSKKQKVEEVQKILTKLLQSRSGDKETLKEMKNDLLELFVRAGGDDATVFVKLKHDDADKMATIASQIAGSDNADVVDTLESLSGLRFVEEVLEAYDVASREKIEADLNDNLPDPTHLKTGENKKPLPYKHREIDLKLHLSRFNIPSWRAGITAVDVKYHRPDFSLLKKLTI